MSQQVHEPAAMPTPDTAIDTRHELISSRRVEGTPVYNRAEKKLGTIHSVMIDKRSGAVAYAVLSFGGFLGIGERVTPVPWPVLTYSVDLDAYVIDLSREQLAAAPSLRLDHADRPQSGDYADIKGYYEEMRWWGL
ncbi:PRC-barrel domain-containing protein [Sphingosinicella ginsenosidimutans]|uniref:PRC-barrel domain containing protein n=1 Tax=Allosphingosinicella ginsenosidimutans TaxID=1176539 RepID=A0A5C6TV91_9SPHN|nr:PRC-barrel domain-containing protein [Sphingosinicella ginsenosidimutans]TXC63618.1 PRC-barrel domain containing protein [Sphingosinicella ginsenosidimutans]